MKQPPLARAARRVLVPVLAAALGGACSPAGPAPGAVETAPAPAPDSVQVGYGARPADRVAGAVASVEVERDEAARAVRVEQLLEGRFAGVDVVRTADGRYAIRIRGAGGGEPLVVVNGVPTIPGSDPLAGINPKDVARIDVLRDAASAAIYGSRGGNGVVLIATRRGEP